MKLNGYGEAYRSKNRASRAPRSAYATRAATSASRDARVDGLGDLRHDLRLRPVVLGEMHREVRGVERAPAQRGIHELRLRPQAPHEQNRCPGAQERFHVSRKDSIPPDDTGLHYNCDRSQRFGFRMELRRLGLLILALACLSQARAAPFAYVPNERSGTVSVIDTASDQVVATIKTGGKPRGIAATPDGRRLYVSDQPSGSLLVVDLATREVSERIR